jgi:hypothetical protein
MMRTACPQFVDGRRVVCYSPIDARHQPTGNTVNIVGGMVLGPAAGVAICQDGDAYFFIGCDENWDALSDSLHLTLEEAKRQAEFEYAGVSKTWVTV